MRPSQINKKLNTLPLPCSRKNKHPISNSTKFWIAQSSQRILKKRCDMKGHYHYYSILQI